MRFTNRFLTACSTFYSAQKSKVEWPVETITSEGKRICKHRFAVISLDLLLTRSNSNFEFVNNRRGDRPIV